MVGTRWEVHQKGTSNIPMISENSGVNLFYHTNLLSYFNKNIYTI